MRTLIRYFTIGCLAVSVHFFILFTLIEYTTTDPVIATSLGFSVAVVFNYFCQYRWTFKANGPHRRLFFRFALIALLMLAVNAVLFNHFNQQMRMPYLFAQILTSGIVFLCSFTLNRTYTFHAAR